MTTTDSASTHSSSTPRPLCRVSEQLCDLLYDEQKEKTLLLQLGDEVPSDALRWELALVRPAFLQTQTRGITRCATAIAERLHEMEPPQEAAFWSVLTNALGPVVVATIANLLAPFGLVMRHDGLSTGSTFLRDILDDQGLARARNVLGGACVHALLNQVDDEAFDVLLECVVADLRRTPERLWSVLECFDGRLQDLMSLLSRTETCRNALLSATLPEPPSRMERVVESAKGAAKTIGLGPIVVLGTAAVAAAWPWFPPRAKDVLHGVAERIAAMRPS